VPTPPPAERSAAPLAGKRPPTLWIATVIVVLQAVACWAYITFLVTAAGDEDGIWRVIGFFAMYAIAFTFLSVGLWRRRGWTRAPLIVLQLLLSVVGFSMVNGSAPAPGAVLVVLSVGCAGLLLVSQTREALG
jgi:peptidoglycan/LPS O-acetylase OafA/YrhL